MTTSETFRTSHLTVVVHPDRIELRESAPNAEGWAIFIPASTKTIFLTSITNVEEEGSNLSYLLTKNNGGVYGRTLVLHTVDGHRHTLNLMPGQLEMVRDTILKRRADLMASQRLAPQSMLPQQPQSAPTLTPEPPRLTGISCPSCGGDLPGRFAKCIHCRSDIYWAANGTGFPQQSQAQAHDAAYLAREEQAKKDARAAYQRELRRSELEKLAREKQAAQNRIAAERRKRTHAVRQIMTAALKSAAPLNRDGSAPNKGINPADRKRLSEVITDAIKHLEELQREMLSWVISELPQSEGRDDKPLTPSLPPDLQVTYEKLLRLRSVAEAQVAETNANLPRQQSRSINPVLHSVGGTDHDDVSLAEDALDPALWQWILTATACVAAADGRLGQREMDAISEALKAHGCPLAEENLRQEIISTCKRVHKEGARTSATNLCQLLNKGTKSRESAIILSYVRSVSSVDAVAGTNETELIRYFTDMLKAQGNPR